MTTTVTNNDDTRFLLATTPTPHHTEPEREASTSRRFRTLLHLLASDKSDEDDDQTSTPRRRASFKERVLISCCSCAGPASPAREDPNGVVLVHLQGQSTLEPQVNHEQEQQQEGGMNLAEALAVEREFRVAETTTGRVSLMALLEAAEREALEEEDQEDDVDVEVEVGVGVGPCENNNVCCCVCMVRKKGAAIIPCGHTFCRICAKQVWVNRGSCPLCNKLILDVLNIF